MFALLGLAFLAGCPAEGGEALGTIIRVNDASEETLITIADAVDSGGATIDDTKAAQLVAPAPGAQVPRATPPQFAWAIPQQAGKCPRHGLTSGDFVWLHFDAPGLLEPIDVVAVDVTNWTPTADEWANFTAATGTFTVTLTYAFVDNGVIVDGPYQGTMSSATFTLTE
jgi:hypothetical protein